MGLRGRPFFYGGLLNIFNTKEGGELRPNDTWSNLDTAKARFQDAYFAMSSRKGGGVISAMFHPCEFVHKQFWDSVNFADGANPPRDQWELPPVKTPEETEKAFQYFEDLVHFLKSFPRVQFLTASGAAERFRDHAQNHVFSAEEIGGIAGQVDPEVSFQTGESFSLSASEAFYVINKYLAGVAAKAGQGPIILESTPYGPASAHAPLSAKLVAPWHQVARTVLDVQDTLDKTNQIPSTIWLGSQPVPPESYLVAIAQADSKSSGERPIARFRNLCASPLGRRRLRCRRFPRPLGLGNIPPWLSCAQANVACQTPSVDVEAGDEVGS